MRLAAFKAHGFKSFADPVSFKVGGELTAVVGPNGCGKSNIVDAVRWVLGESRASSLRGNTLADVMFNGTEKRSSADWCEVEVRFSNEKGEAGGMWASYPEIIVRRELSRDGRQSYTINGATVRRRDVVDLFRGTGVTPRSYGVVEQGMVTDIAEASPEELRNFMEEAAGVSHYKERRRDSERRLQASNDNLAQLALVQEGLTKRVESLKRQARTARRHRELGEAINRLDALLILSRRDASEGELAASRERLREYDAKVKKIQETLDTLKTQSEENKAARNAAQAEVDTVAAALSEVQQLLAAAEHEAQNAAEGKDLAHSRWQEAKDELAQLGEQAVALRQEEQDLQQQQVKVRETIQKNAGVAEQEAEELVRLQVERENVQSGMDDIREKLNAAARQLEGETMRRQLLEERLAEVDKRLAAAVESFAQLPPQEEVTETLTDEEAAITSATTALAAARERHEQAEKDAAAVDAEVRQLEKDIAKRTAEIDTLRAMLREDGWQEGERLAELLQVDAGEWARALDAALGMYAAARAVDDINTFIGGNELPPPGAAVVDMHPAAAEAASNATGLPPLLDKLQMPPERRRVMEYWLSGIYAADDEKAAASARGSLGQHQLVVTRGGVVYGAHSVLVTGETRGGYNWEQRMSELQAAQEKQQGELAQKIMAHERAQDTAKTRSADAAALADKLTAAQQALAEQRIEQNRRVEQQRAAQQRREELTQLQADLQRERAQIADEQTALSSGLDNLQSEHESHQDAFEKQKGRLDNAAAALDSYREVVHAAVLERRDLERRAEELVRQLNDMETKKRENEERQQLMKSRVSDFEREVKRHDASTLQSALTSHREKVATAEAAVAAKRDDLQAVEQRAAQIDEQRERTHSEQQAMHQKAADERVKERELSLKVGYENDALDELGLSAQQQGELKGEEGSVATWQAEMDDLRGKRDRLGAINFMADSELSDCESNLSEMERQRADVEAAIAELKAAIRRIDDETQTRLSSMFEGVNKEFSEMYKRIFDGGEARLEMVGEDILDSGFELKVRPPGKRLFPVRMLSGGEKAASAAAFLFSILRLNPPPFCILDEVDAPLDDNRSQRFVDLLKDISKTVQCLVVTHNKSTISSMPRLIGVTQEEPGASKIVSVTLKDALQAASR